MLEKFGRFEEPFHFLTADNDRKLFGMLYLWKFELLIFNAFRPISKPKAIDSKFKIRIGGSIVIYLNLIQIIGDLVWVDLGGNPVKMKGQFGQMAAIAPKGTLTLSRYHNFLMKSFVK
jgi:hypothetical protein